MTNAIVRARDHELVAGSILTDFGKFLRLHTADGDASPLTLHSYHANAAQFVEWCGGRGINPATATEDDLLAYRRALANVALALVNVASVLAMSSGESSLTV